MSREGVVTSRFNEQDHVRPQTLFPALITTRDLTSPLFLYVLNNILRARRYGAQTTRTGTMTNHVVAIILSDGEITSNLRLTQALYDALLKREALAPAQPVDPRLAATLLGELLPRLLQESGVQVIQLLAGAELATTLAELPMRNGDGGVGELIEAATRDSRAYYSAYVEKKGKK